MSPIRSTDHIENMNSFNFFRCTYLSRLEFIYVNLHCLEILNRLMDLPETINIK